MLYALSLVLLVASFRYLFKRNCLNKACWPHCVFRHSEFGVVVFPWLRSPERNSAPKVHTQLPGTACRGCGLPRRNCDRRHQVATLRWGERLSCPSPPTGPHYVALSVVLSTVDLWYIMASIPFVIIDWEGSWAGFSSAWGLL